MKKVRFESSHPSCVSTRMEDLEECHSPRPFIGLQAEKIPPTLQEPVCSTFIPRKLDVLEMYEGSNSYPYGAASKTTLGASALPRWTPSNELDLSMLDSSSQEPRKPVFMKAVTHNPILQHISIDSPVIPREERQVLNSIENSNAKTPPNILTKDSSFFIRRDNLKMGQLPSLNNLGYQFPKLNIDKENNPIAAKAEIMKKGALDLTNLPSQQAIQNTAYINPASNIHSPQDGSCNCHHCRPIVAPQTNGCQKHISAASIPHTVQKHISAASIPHTVQKHISAASIPHTVQKVHNQCPCVVTYCVNCVSETHINRQPCQTNAPPLTTSPKPQNAVDQKIWAIEKYEQSKTGGCTDVEKSSPLVKEKREPTVSDLFKIIKLQNEQLQLLQQKVDRFIASNNNNNHQQQMPTQYVTEKVAVQALENNDHKISIGVMTSFEMFRTSTVINKEVTMQTHQNVQCNRSEISIKEVAFRQPGNLNFLDGISPVSKDAQDNFARNGQKVEEGLQCNIQQPGVEKSMNEISLCDVHVDNTTTPLISPEPTMYLDVRDYSDSDSTSDDQSNVGWTYYNKVMTHVNGMLQDSDMPSSASALYRDTRQRYVQMQIDKTNISVTKRVKFDDDPPVFHQPQPANPSSTDTSMKMHQLAAKYGIRSAPAHHVPPAIVAPPADQSLATRNYMERHRIMQGPPQPYAGNVRSPALEMPRFLDITALKQQPKLL